MTRLAPEVWALLRGQGVPGLDVPVELLIREQLGGLAYWQLRRLDSVKVRHYPQLQHEYRTTAGANLGMLSELRRIFARRPSLRHRVMVLPGASLLSLYPDLGCRPMDDMDVLAAPSDYRAVAVALRLCGLQTIARHPGLLVRRGLTLDLHRDPLNTERVPARSLAGGLDVQTMWSRRRRIELDGMEVLVPGMWDEVMYTAAHAVRHGYSRLTWLLDLALLADRIDDWSGLKGYARHWGLTHSLLDGLYLLQYEIGAAIPGGARDWLAQELPGPGERTVLLRAYRDGDSGEWGDLLWSFGIPRMTARFRFLLATAFPRIEVLMQVFPALPQEVAPLAYVLRVGQLLRRALALGLRLMRRRIP